MSTNSLLPPRELRFGPPWTDDILHCLLEFEGSAEARKFGDRVENTIRQIAADLQRSSLGPDEIEVCCAAADSVDRWARENSCGNLLTSSFPQMLNMLRVLWAAELKERGEQSPGGDLGPR